MLRLHVHCSLLVPPDAGQVKLGSIHGPWLVQCGKTQRLPRGVPARALKDETDGGGGTSGLPGRSWDPGLEVEVPFEQRPVSPLPDPKTLDSVIHWIVLCW